MRRLSFFVFVLLAGIACQLSAAPQRPAAILVIVADQHSAYERAAQLVARVDQLKAENPGVPLAVLIDGDAFEFGNAVAKRSGGAIDFALLAALAQRGPTILNLGNHEPEFTGMAETVEQLRAVGVVAISNAVNRMTGAPFAPASTRLKLGAHSAVVVGMATDNLATYRVAVRPTLELSDPATWAKANLARLFEGTELPVILSHAGLRADREIIPIAPPGTLFAGAHDHLRFVHHEGRTVYFHSGSWNQYVSIARLLTSTSGSSSERGTFAPARYEWRVEQARIAKSDPADPELEGVIAETFAKNLSAEDRKIVGRLDHELNPEEAARWIVHAVRKAANADAAFVGGTTFGGGLPAGAVSRYAVDGCVRFDGAIAVGEVTGAQLAKILARARQGPETPFAERTGEILVGDAVPSVEPQKHYRIAVSDWIAQDPRKNLGVDALSFTSLPELKLKAIALAELREASSTETRSE